MPRRRMIDPGLWDDLTVANLSIPARLCFIGMISNADDEGRIEANPRYIKRAVFGFDEAVSYPDVAEFLSEIERGCPNIQFYEIDGRLLASFRNWRRYQYIQKPQTSRLPAPPATDDSNVVSVASEHHTDTLPTTDDYHTDMIEVSPSRIEVNRIEVNKKLDVNARARAETESDQQQQEPVAQKKPTLEETKARLHLLKKEMYGDE